jgi:hypothetical protein
MTRRLHEKSINRLVDWDCAKKLLLFLLSLTVLAPVAAATKVNPQVDPLDRINDCSARRDRAAAIACRHRGRVSLILGHHAERWAGPNRHFDFT